MRHRFRACHAAVVLAAAMWIGPAACIQGTWEPTDQRTCAPDSPPRVCVAGADHGESVVVGDTELIPGECAQGPAREEGWVVAHVTDASGNERRKSVHVRGDQAATIVLRGKRRPKVQRSRCTR